MLHLRLEDCIKRHSGGIHHVRDSLVRFVTGDPEIHKALTRQLLRVAGAGGTARSAASFAGIGLLPVLAVPMTAASLSAQVIELAILHAAKHYAKKGKLSKELRREVLEFLNRNHL